MGFWDDVGNTLVDVAPFVVGAAAGYFAGPSVGQEARLGTEVAIHGRPKKPPTYITQNITQPLYVAGGGASSERGITVLGSSAGTGTLSGTSPRGLAWFSKGAIKPVATTAPSQIPGMMWLLLLGVGAVILFFSLRGR